ncbi:MAG: ankyrin repeat domain-containing protein, partial [bacterium]
MSKKTPFPTLGEFVRFVIDAFGFNESIKKEDNDTVASDKFRKELKAFAQEKDFNLERANDFINESFKKYLELVFDEDKEKTKIILSIFNAIICSYKDLVLNVNTKYCNRLGVSIILVEHFLNYFSHLSIYLKDNFNMLDTPEVKYWYLINFKDGEISYPVSTVIDWWLKRKGKDNLNVLAKDLSIKDNNTQGILKRHYSKLHRWKNNKNVNPYAFSIMELLDDKEPSSKFLVINLFIARAVQYSIGRFVELHGYKLNSPEGQKFYNRYIYTFYKNASDLKIDIVKKMTNEEHQKFLYLAVGKEKAQNHIEQMSKLPKKDSIYINHLLNKLNKLTDLKSYKRVGDITIVNNILAKLKENEIINYTYKYYLLWKEARVKLLAGEFKEALELYVVSFKEGRLRAGKDLKEIIRECYCLASYLEIKTINQELFMKKMHNWGVLYLLFTEDYEEINIGKKNENANMFMLLHKQQFFNIFNLKAYYPEADKTLIEKLEVEEEKTHRYSLDNLNRDLTEWHKEKIAKNYNDRGKCKGNGYPFITYNQPMKFAITNQFKKLKSTVEKGVRLDITNNDNASVLYYAIKEGNLEIAQYLLEQKKINKVINMVTYREKMTPLGEMVALTAKNIVKDNELYLEVLKSLLDRGADVNQRYSLEGLYPLYEYIRFLNSDKNMSADNDDSENIILDIKNASRNNFLRTTTRNTFAKELNQNDISKTYDLEFYKRRVKKVLQGNNSMIKKAIKILLDNKQIDINQESFKGYTPLLLLA